MTDTPDAARHAELYEDVVLTVEIPADEVRAAFEHVYAEIRQGLKVPGHPRGQAPMEVVRSMLAGRVGADVLLPLLNEQVPKALAKAGYDSRRSAVRHYDEALLEEGRPFHVTLEFSWPKPRTDAELFEELAQDFTIDTAWRLDDLRRLVERSGSAPLRDAFVLKLKEVAPRLARESEGATIAAEAFGWELAEHFCAMVVELSPDDKEAASLRAEYAAMLARLPRPA
jgi:hypothetical protein